MQARRSGHWLPLAGIAGPLVFTVTVVVAAALRPGYSHIDQFMSDLGATGTSFAWVMNYFGFMVSASLILLFVLTAPTRMPRTVVRVLATLFLAVFAVNVFLAGIFSCDAGCPLTNRSPEQELHDLVSVLAFPAFILGVALWGSSLVRTSGWRRFGLYSLATAAVSVGLLVLMVRSEALRQGTGAYQRLFLGVLFLWLMAFAYRLWRGRDYSDPANSALEE